MLNTRACYSVPVRWRLMVMPIDFVCRQRKTCTQAKKNLHAHTHTYKKALKILRVLSCLFSLWKWCWPLQTLLIFCCICKNRSVKVDTTFYFFPTLCSLNLAVGSSKNYPWPPRPTLLLSTFGAVKDWDNWQRLSGGISCWNGSLRDCAPLFMCISALHHECALWHFRVVGCGNNNPQNSFIPMLKCLIFMEGCLVRMFSM